MVLQSPQQYFEYKLHSLNKALQELKSLVPKSNKSTFGTSKEKQVSLTEFIHMSVGKQNLQEKKCICVSYLDLNFTPLLAF